jgi:hypothetical protein
VPLHHPQISILLIEAAEWHLNLFLCFTRHGLNKLINDIDVFSPFIKTKDDLDLNLSKMLDLRDQLHVRTSCLLALRKEQRTACNNSFISGLPLWVCNSFTLIISIGTAEFTCVAFRIF